MAKFQYTASVYTDAGPKNNEDSKLLRRAERCFAAIIADGVGGEEAGEVASGYTVKALSKWFDKVEPDLPNMTMPEIRAEMDRIVMRVHEELLDISEEKRVKFGSTLTFALLTKDEYLIGQVGDSRAYFYEDGIVRCITVDQTVAEYERASGQIVLGIEEDRKEHTLLQCMGQGEISPVYYSGGLNPEYQILICSDGLSNTLTEGDIAKVLSRELSCKEKLIKLTEKSRENGETDNITSVLIRRARCD